MFSILTKMFKKEYEKGVTAGRKSARDEERNSRREIEEIVLRDMIGHPVIVVTNEWGNPIVGIAKRIEYMTKAQNPVLVYENFLSEEKEEVICGGVSMFFSDQRLNTALTLNPFELWAICATNSHGHGDFDKPKREERWSKERCHEVLHKNGFFEYWEKFKAAEKQKD